MSVIGPKYTKPKEFTTNGEVSTGLREHEEDEKDNILFTVVKHDSERYLDGTYGHAGRCGRGTECPNFRYDNNLGRYTPGYARYDLLIRYSAARRQRSFAYCEDCAADHYLTRDFLPED